MKTFTSCARLAALPLALAAAFPSFAQTQLKDVVVTATRVAQPITDVVADVTILDRAVIERSGAVGLADVLARVPGIAMARNGGLGTTTSVYLRGAESRFTAVLIDGVRVDSQSTGGATWSAIPLSRIDHIEIIRGPAAAIYGSDAIAGVIQIFTRKGEQGFSPAIEVGAGTYGTKKLDVSLSGGQGSLDYALGLTREISTGFNAQPTVNPDKDGYLSTSASASLGFQLNSDHRFETTLLSNDQRAQYDGFTPGQDDWGHQKLQTIGVNWSARWSDLYSTKVSVNQGRDRYETSPSVYVTDTTVTSYLLQNEFRSGANLLTAALERREDRLNNASTTPVITDRSQNGLALGYGYTGGKHTIQLNGRHDQDSEFGSVSTGSAAYAYAFQPNWRVTASAGTAFRAPTLFQRFSIYGVPTLMPESARNKEIGIKYQTQGESFSAVVYRNAVSNLITYVPGAGACINGAGEFAGCYGNTAMAQYSGLTLAASKAFGAVNLTGSLDLQDPKDQATGKVLVKRAKKLATFGADTQIAAWKAGAEVQLSGERFNNAANTQRLAGYGLVNLYASTQLVKDWSLLARIDNLGNKTYETAKGYATAGRTLYVGLKWAPYSF